MQLRIKHKTSYRYDQPVTYALQKMRLRPQRSPVQTVVSWDVKLHGGKIEADYEDHYGNHVDLVNVDRDATEVTVTASGVVETHDATGILGFVYGRAPLWHFRQQTELTEPGERVRSLAAGISDTSDKLAALHGLSAAIIQAAPYIIGVTDSRTPAEKALEHGAGVCQDHAQIFVSAARVVGIPARYVSGYLMMNDRVDQDAAHAWAEAHIEGLGWVGFDVSNGISPDERYVRVAVGRDARDAAPTEGLLMGNLHEQMIVSLQVQQ